jgi:hypothetical protein
LGNHGRIPNRPIGIPDSPDVAGKSSLQQGFLAGLTDIIGPCPDSNQDRLNIGVLIGGGIE